MLFGDLNTNLLLFFIIFSSIILNNNTSLHLLLTAELLWITLFSLVLTIGLIYNDLNILSLTFFFLVLSAIEFGLGLVLLLLQYILNRTTQLFDLDSNFTKFNARTQTTLYTNRIIWS